MLKKVIFLPVMTLVFVAAHFCIAAVLLSAPLQLGKPQVEQSQMEREMENRQQKEANEKRQKEIRDDTQKLFQLATELKAAVDKSNEHVLSLDVIKKAEEVEKLAKKVKDRMKESVGKPVYGEDEPIPHRRLR